MHRLLGTKVNAEPQCDYRYTSGAFSNTEYSDTLFDDIIIESSHNMRYDMCHFKNVTFVESVFNTVFNECKFTNCTFTDVRFVNTKFRSCIIQKGQFKAATFDKDVDMEDILSLYSLFDGVTFEGDVASSTFAHSVFRGTVFTGRLNNTVYESCLFKNTQWQDSDGFYIKFTRFLDCTFENADCYVLGIDTRGFQFVLFRLDTRSWYISAGCRFMTLNQAAHHWGYRHEDDPLLAIQCNRMVDYAYEIMRYVTEHELIRNQG